jgi:hypothetical protein
VRLKELRRFPAEILYPVPASGGYAAVTAEGLFMANRRVALGRDARFGVTPRTQHLIAAWLHGRRLELFDVTAGVPVQAGLEAEALTSYDGRLYLKRGAALFEVEFLELPSGVRAALKPVGNAMEHSTQLFDGVAMQSMLGAVHASVFPRAGACYSRRLVELDDYRVVDARFEKGVLMAVGVKDGRYDRFVFRFDERYCGHDTRVASDVAYAGLNFVVLDNGVCVHLNEAEELELFSSRIGSTGTRTVQDDAIRGARLHKDGTQVLLSRGETLYGATLT